MIDIKLEGKQYQLDIEQAKKLNLLKEKNSRVKSWEEFTKKHDRAYIVDERSAFPQEANVFCTQSQLTVYEAKAIAAFSKLLKLRRDWIGEWEPDWLEAEYKFTIVRNAHGVTIFNTYFKASALSFPSKQMACDFLKTFHNLIEEAKILI